VATEFGATVGAAILEHMDGTVFGAGHNHRRRAHVRTFIVPAVGNLGLERDEIPGRALKNPFYLAGVYIITCIDPVRDGMKTLIRPDQLFDRLIFDARRTEADDCL
jgi:hypothetical protein